jgi:streptogramin lyase
MQRLICRLGSRFAGVSVCGLLAATLVPPTSGLAAITGLGGTVFPVQGVVSEAGPISSGKVAAGPDGNIWFGGKAAGELGGFVAKVTPSGAVTEYSAALGYYRGDGEVKAVTRGPDGNLWFTGDVHLPNGSYTVPADGSGRFHLPDGSVTPPGEPYARSVIGKATTAGVITEYTIGTSTPPVVTGTEAFDITAGPDGDLWFAGTRTTGATQSGVGVIGKITTAGVVTEYTPAGITFANGIAAGPDGNLWFNASVGKVGKITPAGAVTEYPAGISGETRGITRGPDGNMWFLEAGKVAKITTSGRVTEYSRGLTKSPTDIASGPDGNLWVIDFYSDRIERVTTAGAVTQYAGSATRFSAPCGITQGPDRNLWITYRVGYHSAIQRFSVPKTNVKHRGRRHTSHRRRHK